MPEPDDPPPPPPTFAPSPVPPPPPPASGGWWIAWIFSTVVVPGLIVPVAEGLTQSDLMTVFGWLILGGILILHVYSSVKLGKGRSGCLVAALIPGGWLLMAIAFFVGCVSVMSNMSHR